KRVELAGKLLQKAAETKDDLTARFVLMREARELFVQGGDLQGALKVVDDLAQVYAIDPYMVKLTILTTVSGSVATVAAGQALLDSCFPLVDELIAGDDFDTALRVVEVATVAVKKVNNAALITRAETRAKAIRDMQKEFEQIKPALATLEKTPDDPEAN